MRSSAAVTGMGAVAVTATAVAKANAAAVTTLERRWGIPRHAMAAKGMRYAGGRGRR